MQTTFNKIKFLTAVLIGFMSLNSQAAYILYTGTAYYGWKDQRGLLSPSLSSGLNDPVSLEIDFTPTSISNGFYFFDTANMHLKVGGSSWDGSVTLNPNYPSLNEGYFDSQGLCCGGTPAFSFTYNNNQYAGGLKWSIGIFGGSLNFSTRYFDPAKSFEWSGYTYYNPSDTNLSAHSGSFVFDPVADRYIAPVPEPETYAMMLAGLGVMGAIARRRKAKQTA